MPGDPKNQMIWYEPTDADSDDNGAVKVDEVVRLIKAKDEDDVTLIHLKGGDVLRSKDSMKTLKARIELA